MQSDWAAVLSGTDSPYTLREPASTNAIARAEAALQTRLPAQLRTLYATTDGILDREGKRQVLWQLDRLVEANGAAYANEGHPRSRYIGFGDDGTGNPYCVRRDGHDEVIHWNPIDSRATHLADTLMDFWLRLNDGTLPAH